VGETLVLINIAPPLNSDHDRRAPAALAHALGAQVRDEQSLLRRGEASGRTLRVGVKGAFARAPAGTPKLPPGTPEEEEGGASLAAASQLRATLDEVMAQYSARDTRASEAEAELAAAEAAAAAAEAARRVQAEEEAGEGRRRVARQSFSSGDDFIRALEREARRSAQQRPPPPAVSPPEARRVQDEARRIRLDTVRPRPCRPRPRRPRPRRPRLRPCR